MTPAGAWPTIVTKAKTLWRFCFSFLWISCVSFIRSNKSKIYTQTHTHAHTHRFLLFAIHTTYLFVVIVVVDVG